MENHTIFRAAALEHRVLGNGSSELLRLSPVWTWTLVATLAGLLMVALVLAVFGRVEVQGRGQGILRSSGGARPLQAQVGGVLKSVNVHPGQKVRKGDLLAELDSVTLQAQLFEADRQIQQLENDARGLGPRTDALFISQEQNLRQRIASLVQQGASLAESGRLFERKLETARNLKENGLVSSATLEDAEESLAQARRSLLTCNQSIAAANQELASLSQRFAEDRGRRYRDLQTARTHRDSLAFSLSQTRFLAPEDGTFESFVARPGDSIQPGQVLGRLVSVSTSFQAIGFLPEKDRAFVKSGDTVKVELEQYPYGEFGTLPGRVVRVGEDLAAPYEVREALGEGTPIDRPLIRVELEIFPIQNQRLTLRPGMMLQVRFTLRRQRPITIFLEPLKKWLN